MPHHYINKEKLLMTSNYMLPKPIPTTLTLLRKHLILFIISLSGILPPLSSTIYFPSLSALKKEFNTSDTLVDLTITVYMLILGIFPLIWGGMSDRFGRRRVFLISQIIYNSGNIGCALSRDINDLIGFRVLQGIGASATIVSGVGIIADIFEAEERGSKLALFFLGPLIGPVIGPIIGGALFDAYGWRSTFWCLTLFSSVLLISSIFLLDETLPVFNRQKFPIRITFKPFSISKGGSLFNPFSSLRFLRYPIVILTCLCIAITFGSFFIVESNISKALPEYYNLTPTQTGLTFIPLCIGNILGNLLGGKISDLNYLRYQRKNPNIIPPPEVRLYFLYSGSIIESIGLFTTAWFLESKSSIYIILITTFFIGFGKTISQIASSNYLVDHFPESPASIAACFTAAQMVFTGVLMSLNTLVLQELGYAKCIGIYGIACGIVAIFIFSLIWLGDFVRRYTGPTLEAYMKF